MKIGKIISSLRKQRHWKQKDLADKIGVSSTAVSAIESSKSYPKISTLNNIAKIFGVTFEYMILLTIEDMKVDSDLEVEFEVYFKKLKKIIEQSNKL